MKILVLDVGGTHVKMSATGQDEVRKFASGPDMTPERMVKQVKEAVADWEYDVISIGYPGPVVNGKPLLEPKHLAPGWVSFDFARAFGKPVKIINDAAMQALGSYRGGRMLFLGLGTGLGSTLIVDNVVVPMELAHLPYKKGKTIEQYVGLDGLERRGPKKWQKSVEDVVARLKAALIADHVVIGGGNARKLKEVPPGARLGDNNNAIIGGFRMWEEHAPEFAPHHKSGAGREAQTP
jgi:polyphosphate glucokinase